MVKRVHPSDILRAARKRIAAYKNGHLCYAIDDVRVGTVEQKTALKRRIAKALNYRPTFTAWLSGLDYSAYSAALAVRGGVRKARLAWVDTLIAECEKEEAQHGAA